MKAFLQRALRHRSFMLGAFLSFTMLAMALVSFFWTPHSAEKIVIKNRLLLPSWEHWMGTDHFGRDILSMVMAGAQTSISVGLLACGIGALFGVSLGLTAAAKRGWIEEIIMRGCDFSFAFPVILLAVLITAVGGPGITNAILALALVNIPIFARMVRGTANSIWTREFILAARAAGKSTTRITLEHILPNLTSLIIVQATIQFAIAILAESALSYLGLGAQPPAPSWGRMLSESQTLMYQYPRLAIFPGLTIMLAVLGLNLLGDGLRDLFDPRLSRKR
jgi:peptide/nickel transport system permease protein